MTDVSREQAPTLERTLGLGSVVLIELAYMTPLIVLGTYGVVADLSNGTVPTAYLVTLIAMLFTAFSYGRMASVHPIAGSAYTYVGREMGPQLGFLSGWLIQLDYFFLPMVAWLIGGNLFASFFLAGLIVAQFAAGLAIQATSSRLLYAIGGDGVLPRPIFATFSLASAPPCSGSRSSASSAWRRCSSTSPRRPHSSTSVPLPRSRWSTSA